MFSCSMFGFYSRAPTSDLQILLSNYKHHLLDLMQFDFMAASVRYLMSTLPVCPFDF